MIAQQQQAMAAEWLTAGLRAGQRRDHRAMAESPRASRVQLRPEQGRRDRRVEGHRCRDWQIALDTWNARLKTNPACTALQRALHGSCMMDHRRHVALDEADEGDRQNSTGARRSPAFDRMRQLNASMEGRSRRWPTVCRAPPDQHRHAGFGAVTVNPVMQVTIAGHSRGGIARPVESRRWSSPPPRCTS